ncbi:MAG: type III-A CRISPR-associated protein Csm2 [Flavobacteriaceae bacterium]|nr:type III-A CRISPR-associated protein Csm2 [Flavobacteriaceae bacterium]
MPNRNNNYGGYGTRNTRPHNTNNNQNPPINIRETYFKETYQYLLNLKDDNVPLDNVFSNIETFVKEECRAITTTQLRNIYSKIISVSDVASLKMLRPNIAYIAARQIGKAQYQAKNVVMFYDKLIQGVKDEKHLESFKKVMEAIVAYHKYHHNKQ